MSSAESAQSGKGYDTSAHLVVILLSLREREKRDRKLVEERKERKVGERKVKYSDETEEILTYPLSQPAASTPQTLYTCNTIAQTQSKIHVS